MPSTTTDRFSDRMIALRIASEGSGITTSSHLSPELCRVFGLTSDDPTAFVRTLNVIGDLCEDHQAIEAAFSALGIGASVEYAPSDRKLALMQRYSERGDEMSSIYVSLDIIELRGFTLIAASYGMAQRILELEAANQEG